MEATAAATTMVAAVQVARVAAHPLFTSGGMRKEMEAVTTIAAAVQAEPRALAAAAIHPPTGGGTRTERDAGMELSARLFFGAMMGHAHIKSESNCLQQQIGQAHITKKNIVSFNESHCFVELMGQVQFSVCRNGLLAEKLLVSTVGPAQLIFNSKEVLQFRVGNQGVGCTVQPISLHRK